MTDDLAAAVRAGDQRALARVLSLVENRTEGYRTVLADLYRTAGDAHVVGFTGAPGAGKSTLVDSLVAAYRERDETVGVLAVDPSSPFSGGSVLGDRIRMGGRGADDGVFVRSMAARGELGGLATTTAEAVTAMAAYGVDHVLVETVGAGQNEVDVVSLADTVAVLVPPGSGDDVQMLKAGVLEIADVFVVSKADLDGADRTVRQLQTLVAEREDVADADVEWRPPVVEAVGTAGEGVEGVRRALANHREYCIESGRLADRRRRRHRETVAGLVEAETGRLVDEHLLDRDALDSAATAVAAGERDPYDVADAVLAPLRACLDGQLPVEGDEDTAAGDDSDVEERPTMLVEDVPVEDVPTRVRRSDAEGGAEDAAEDADGKNPPDDSA